MQIVIHSRADREAALRAVQGCANGLCVTIGPEPAEPELRKLRGAILTEIADKAWVVDPRSGIKRQLSNVAWGEFYNGLMLGYEQIEMPNGDNYQRPISSNTLMKNRRGYLDYLDKIQADAASNYGVVFSDHGQWRANGG